MKTTGLKILVLLLSLLFTFCSSDDEIISYIESGNVEKIKELLSKGLKPNEPLNEGNTPIYHAINSDNLEILLLLADSGGKLDNQTDNVDYREFVIENDKKEVASWVIANSSQPYTKEHTKQIVIKLINIEWYDIIKEQDYCSKLEFEDLLVFYNEAKEDDVKELLSYLEPILKNYWRIEEFTNESTELDAFYDKIESNKSSFDIVKIKQQTKPHKLTVKFSETKNFMENVLQKLLSKPSKNDDGFRSGLKNSYFHNITVNLPRFLEKFSRHQGYHTHEPPKIKESIWAYLVHRTNRSSENIELLWNLWKETFFETITVKKYVNLDFYRSVETLTSTLDSLKSMPNYEDSLEVFWNNIRDIHANTTMDDYDSYGADWWSGISENFIFKNAHNVDGYWLTSFWMRRHREGNSEIVEKILREIQSHYNNKPSLDKLIEKRDLKDATERFLICAEYNLLSEMKELLKEGVDPNLALGKGGIKKIHVTVMANDFKKLKKMKLDKNNIHQTDDRKYKPLHYANTVQIADYLVKTGEIDLKSDNYSRIISQYIYDKNPELVQWAIKNGVSIETTEKGTPLLIQATPCCNQPVSEEQLKVIQHLLKAGADPHEKRPPKKPTPYEYAQKEGATEILKMFDKSK